MWRIANAIGIAAALVILINVLSTDAMCIIIVCVVFTKVFKDS